MIHLFTGTDSEKVREALNAVIAKSKKTEIVRITDAHTLPDLVAALQGGGMFGGERAVVLDNVFLNEEMTAMLMPLLPDLKKRTEFTMIYHSEPNSALRKTLEKYAEKSERYDIPKKEKKDNFFALANALQRGKKKDLWVLLHQELALGKAPEAIHGSLFWAAKQLVLKPRSTNDATRGKTMVAELAELPHEARRNGFDLEYALEHFVLSRV